MSGPTITPWVVGNWKMNPMRANANQLIEEFKQLLQQNQIADENCHVGVALFLLLLQRYKRNYRMLQERYIRLHRMYHVLLVQALILAKSVQNY